MFGHEAAENEDVARLRDYYFKGDVYNRAIAKLPLRVLVGHKGTGKSALFAVALQENRDAGAVALLVKPDDVLEIAVGETDLLRATRSWKDGLLRLIYDRSLKELGVDDPAAASRYAGTAGRVVQAITDICKPFVDKYASVSSVKKMATARFLENNEIYVYLDDLDRGWTGDKLSILRLSALLNALRDLSSDNPRLFFRVAMRSDVYYLVRTSDESTDKVEGSVVWHSWTNHEILAMMVKRLETFFGRTANESDLMEMRQEKLASYLSPVFDPTFYGQGHWSNIPVHRVLMSLIRKRPRDLVKLCTLAAQGELRL
jgi:hypothetical protein